MVDLSAHYGGVKLKNPLISASAAATHTPENCERNAIAGFGAVVLKCGVTDLPKHRMCKCGSPMVRIYSGDRLHPWKPTPPKKSDPKVLGKKGKVQPDYLAANVVTSTAFYYNWDPDYITFL